MKICCIADIHLGMKLYGKTDPVTHFNSRELNTLDNLRGVVDYCIDNDIKVLIIAGDTYHNSLPTPTLQDEVNKIIKYASDNDIHCLILAGNHDVSKLDTAVTALKPLDTFHINNVVHTKQFKDMRLTVNDEQVRFVFLPTYHTGEGIKEITDKIQYDGTPIVYIGHMTVQGAALNDWLIGTNESYVDMSCFKHDGVKATVLGHLHKPQILDEEKMIFYTGSLQRLDFNEENQKKGFFVLDVSDDKDTTYTYHEVDSQLFYTLSLNVIGNINSFDYVKKMIAVDRVKNAIVRIKLEADSASKLTTGQEKDIYEYLQSLGADTILNIQQKVTDNEKVRNAAITEYVSMDKGLELYFDNQLRKDERIKLGKKILDMVNGND